MKTTLTRFLAVAFLVAAGTVGTAAAAPAQHDTETFTGTFTVEGPVSCGGGPLYDQTQNVTFTDVLVTNSGQTLHDRGTVDASFTGTPLDASLPTVSGTFEGRSTFHFSQIGAAGETAVGVTTATYSDGTKVTTHETIHFTVRHDGMTVSSFDRCVSSP
ncbi:hypothetical protein ABT095_18475 [Kitasatospora sp. NPDC002227]|uniref:hypothetical protein n=1 Tax=Kitasatospora sp. NPDC002227 TaxID=3154773 RepID=UPI003323F247